MRTARRRNEQLVAPRSGTRRSFQIVGWALALALGGLLGLAPLRLTSLANPLPIPATLLPAALAATVRLPPGLAGTPGPPPLGCLLTRRTAIPRLRAARHKGLLAPLQQTATPPRPPARGLPSTRSSIMLKKTQGSVNSRRSSLGEEPLSSPRHLIPKALSLGLPPLQTSHPRPRPPLGERQTRSYLPRGRLGLMVTSYLGSVSERLSRWLRSCISARGTFTPDG
jgi:hypothetical protein